MTSSPPIENLARLRSLRGSIEVLAAIQWIQQVNPEQGVGIRQLADALNQHQRTVRRKLQKLTDLGLISLQDRGAWQLTRAGWTTRVASTPEADGVGPGMDDPELEEPDKTVTSDKSVGVDKNVTMDKTVTFENAGRDKKVTMDKIVTSDKSVGVDRNVTLDKIATFENAGRDKNVTMDKIVIFENAGRDKNVTLDKTVTFENADRDKNVTNGQEESDKIVTFDKNVARVNHDDDDDELINIKYTESSSSSVKARQIFEISTEQVLKHTHLLFGTSVEPARKVLTRKPEWALAWVSKAFSDMRSERNPAGMNNPAGFVYRRLMDWNEPPPAYLLEDPTRGLPREYLLALGLPEPPPPPEPAPTPGPLCWRCNEDPCICDEVDDELEESPPGPEGLPQPIGRDGNVYDLGPWNIFSRLAREQAKAESDTQAPVAAQGG